MHFISVIIIGQVALVHLHMLQTKILKHDNRSISENNAYKYNRSEVFGHQLLDVVLHQGETFEPPQHHQSLFILPIVGSVEVVLFNGMSKIIDPETIIRTNGIMTIKNSRHETSIHFLIMDGPKVEGPNLALSKIDLPLTRKNELVSGKLGSITFSLGVFDSRKEWNEIFDNARDVIFHLVNGAFDIEGCLVEFKDTLCLAGKKQIEFEALSENAILLMIHQKSNKHGKIHLH